MLRTRLWILVVSFLATGIASTSADVIRSSNSSTGESGDRKFEIVQPESHTLTSIAGKIADAPSWESLSLVPLIDVERVATSVESDLARRASERLMTLPVPSAETLGGGDFGYREPEIASDDKHGQNVRIPEPTSLTLVGAGVIGVAISFRFRRKLQASKNLL